ncbi:transketolase C-terminal domain-containing protein [Microbispora sp. GKU 823]|uniref:transketolase C-terminal domain-containing protein n=1 Tax=Microbispora sp. GKU 823 TaxID=1652100 RepID=UPI0009A2CFC8|nr:transketolase C-terminal domain-containing protein [Microbispora sp. GKU 823]
MSMQLCRVDVADFDRVLTQINDPYERCRAFSALTRVNVLYMIMRAGSGHLGSSFSAADIVSHLLLSELDEPFTPDGDVYFSSKGHDAPGLYAALIGLRCLPEDLLHRLRRLGGLPGHPDVHTPHMAFNTGSLGMGISKAKGLILADRLLGRSRRVFVLTGDGELQEGQNWEALASAAHRGMGELTVIVDHNKLQSDTWVSEVNDLGDLEAKFSAFGWGALRCDGHDFRDLEAALRKRAESFPGQPAVVIADTVKGAGCATFAATSMRPGEWRYRFHSGAPSPEDYRTAHEELVAEADAVLRRNGLGPLRVVAEGPLPERRAGDRPRLFQVYGEALAGRARADRRIVALDADLVLDTGLIPFSREHADRFFEFGIAEQDMVSAAGGLAAGGLVPFVNSFSCFLHARPNEQIYNNATEGRKVIYVGALAGLLPAGPGHSHQAVRDVAALSAVPGLRVLQPANAAEVEAALDHCLATDRSVYLRLESVPVPDEVAALPAGPLVPGRGRVVRQGGRVVVIGAGPTVLGQVLGACELLAPEGLDPTVVNLPWLNEVDPEWLTGLLREADHVIVVENHYRRGGQADTVARALLAAPPPHRPSFHGIGLTEIPRCGADDEALGAHGLDAASLAAAIRDVTTGDLTTRDVATRDLTIPTRD